MSIKFTVDFARCILYKQLMKMNPVVHFEMPATYNKRVKKFYENVFGWEMQQMGEEMGNYLLEIYIMLKLLTLRINI